MFFWNSLAFLMIHHMLAIWSLVPLLFLNPAWTCRSSRFTYYWSLAWRILSISLRCVRWVQLVVRAFFGIAFLWDFFGNLTFSSPVAHSTYWGSNILPQASFCIETYSSHLDSPHTLISWRFDLAMKPKQAVPHVKAPFPSLRHYPFLIALLWGCCFLSAVHILRCYSRPPSLGLPSRLIQLLISHTSALCHDAFLLTLFGLWCSCGCLSCTLQVLIPSAY